jgi:DNA-directed RNA polymerase specialized sigma24 family protein
LFAVAYRMLGSASDAEDVLQDAYRRWIDADGVRDPEAFLVRVVTGRASTSWMLRAGGGPTQEPPPAWRAERVSRPG